VSKEIKKIYPKSNISGNRAYPRSGAFEVEVDGKLVYSKFKTSNFPTISDIKKWVI
jgi:selT/selW/selH-like putative selenoprotein|tara:strand:+ start:3369 stop:3536 length:168 start_codon:yes stop_codon:yes gene_type:complete